MHHAISTLLFSFLLLAATPKVAKTCTPQLKDRIFSIVTFPNGELVWDRKQLFNCDAYQCARFGLEPQSSTDLFETELAVWPNSNAEPHQLTVAFYPFNSNASITPGIHCVWTPAPWGDIYTTKCQKAPAPTLQFHITCKTCYPPPGVYLLGGECKIESVGQSQCVSGSLGEGNLLHLAKCDGSAAQLWDIIKQDEGTAAKGAAAKAKGAKGPAAKVNMMDY
ncbi:hypothetical protein RQP46_002767 [Phenoliferia psychrophenolica]